jgi:hypothetical protein
MGYQLVDVGDNTAQLQRSHARHYLLSEYTIHGLGIRPLHLACV